MATEPQSQSNSAGGAGRAKRILGILAVAVIALAGYEGWHWWSFGRFHEETDDAYLQADLVTLLARDTGYISDILVAPNARVAKGQVIARIDAGDYQLALETAQNSLDSKESAVTTLDAQIDAQNAAIQGSQAALASAQATSDGAQKAYKRTLELKASTAFNQSTLDSAEATAKSAAAQVKNAEAALAGTQADLTVLKTQRAAAVIDVAAAQTALKQAERDLTYTDIRAPFDGVLTERQIETGSYVTAGTRIGTLVPVDRVYAEANFKETQIEHIRPGAEVAITVDAFPDQVLKGTIASLTAGTGQVFSLLPASNATGNFTKVVQRVPIRIEISAEDRARLPLLPGLSVVVSVATRTGSDEALPVAPAASSTADPAATSDAAPAAAHPKEG